MSRRAYPWSVLRIDKTDDRGAIRKAYADALRAIDVDSDIAGYAKLREARDRALWMAAEAARAGADDDLGLGSFDDAEGADPADEPYDEDEWDDWGEPSAANHPDPLSRHPETEPDPARERAEAAWQGLLDILYPEGQQSDAGVTHEELEEGTAHLAVLLARAEEADLAEHNALDHALANMFADAWPRSAPFVEPANAAFHWLGEAGQLEERGALMFLNARLKGMRFHEKVQQADHPLHKAWAELSRPGRAGFIDRLRIKRLDIDKLLTGVRANFPELESFLEPERVASWEGDRAPGEIGNTGPRVVWFAFVMLLVLAVPRCINSLTDPSADTSAPATAALFDPGPSEAEIDAQVADIFGEGTDMAKVRAVDPVFADQLRLSFNHSDLGEDRPLALVRRKALEAGEVASFDELVARAKLRRIWLGAAAWGQAGQCENVMNYDFTSLPLKLKPEDRAAERPLLRQLLDAKVLGHEAKGGTVRFAIPGWAVSDMIERSGLSEDRVRQAMGNTSHPDRCQVEVALLDVVLANPGRLSQDVLRGL
jgi:hypothetical protein